MDKYCPNCGEKYKWYEAECPACRVALAEIPRDQQPSPETALVSVLVTEQPALLPLAQIALEQDGIEYMVQNRGLSDQIIGHRSTMAVGQSKAPLEVLVRTEDAARARALLDELQSAGAVVPAAAAAEPAPAQTHPSRDDAAIELTDAQTGAMIGRITRAQFKSIAAQLEVESTEDNDYYIDAPTLELLEAQGADATAIELLRLALGTRPGMDIRWSRR
jgi:Putative prokaryotic signal transducing protein